MAADPILYCLEHATDYRQFERFCCDLMVRAGWTGIEPLGGSADGGRDALFTGSRSSAPVIFAFSCRKDWRNKLEEDLDRMVECGHPCSSVVFVTSRSVTAAERDEAVSFTHTTHDWDLELFPAERIRTLLSAGARTLIELHPAIFNPAFFPKKVHAETPRHNEPYSVGNGALAAFELGLASQNLEYRVSLAAFLIGPVPEPDLHIPLDDLAARLTAASRVILPKSEADSIRDGCASLRSAASSAETTEEALCGIARALQAQIASSKLFLSEDRAQAAFAVGEHLGLWDRTSIEERHASIATIAPSLTILGLARLLPQIEARLVRFREAKSVDDVHVPSEVSDLVRRALALPRSVPDASTAPDWSGIEELLRDQHRRFRIEGRQRWASAQAHGVPAPPSILELAEKTVLAGDDEDAYAMLDLLRREKAVPPEAWRRLAVAIARGEFSNRERTQQPLAYELVKDPDSIATVFRALIASQLPGTTTDALLSAIYFLVDGNLPLLRPNAENVTKVCEVHSSNTWSAKIRSALG